MTLDLRHLTAAPELLVLDLLDVALHTLENALLVEHPPLASSSRYREAALCRRALALLCSARRLRRAIVAYRRAVDRVLDDRSLPF